MGQMAGLQRNPGTARTRARVPGSGMARAGHVLVVAILTLALALSGGVRAMSPTHAPGVMAMVICSEEGTATIYLDAGGVPVKPAADCWTCPDCTTGSALFLPPTASNAAGDPMAAARPLHPADWKLSFSRHLRPESRGPPPVAHGTSILALAAAPHLPAHRHPAGSCHRNGRPLLEARA